MRNVSSLSRRVAVSCAALGTLAAFATPAAAADLYTGPEGPPPAAYGPPPVYAPPPAYAVRPYAPAYVEEEYIPVPPAPVPVYRPYAWGAPYWYGRPYWGGPRYAERPWGYRYGY